MAHKTTVDFWDSFLMFSIVNGPQFVPTALKGAAGKIKSFDSGTEGTKIA